MKTLQVSLGKRSYDIFIGKGLLENAAFYIKNVANPKRIMIVTDENVAAHHEPVLTKNLQEAGFETKTVIFPAGEGTKSLDSVERLYTEAFDSGMTRTDLVVALGGGVVGDLTGFFASTLLRGVPFVQVPTTLLSQVDSSVGGKTGVNVPAGKNLVGCFYQPKLVLIDTDTLSTLPDKDFSDGMAEVIKYGCILDAPLFQRLQKAGGREGLRKELSEVIYACCDAKRRVVEEDEFDTGLRMILNFGHTMGHVIEKAYHYAGYTHGQAVAAGMVLAAKFGENLSVTSEGTTEKIVEILTQYQLPTEIPLKANWEQSILLDKKMQGKELSCILISQIGEALIHKMPAETFVAGMKNL